PAASPPLQGVAEVVTSYPPASPAGAGPVHAVGATLPVADLGRAVDFYCKVLDFAVVDRAPGVAVVAAGDTRLGLRHAGSGAGAAPVPLNQEVGDVTAAHKALEAAGVPCAPGPVLVGSGARLQVWSAAFTDPDGHALAFTEWRPASPEDRAPDPQQVPPHRTEDDAERPERRVQ
ncbi:MAG TPA: VOC family protein, partial [Pilimelia sp.]|nr:VOC family protein [Pilimelia sp.]